jgi:hypothetical protein
MQLFFLLEEPSMEAFLEAFLPNVLPVHIHYQLIPHQGKQDLQKSIPRKLRAINVPDAKFVILHDQDSHDCKVLKQQLIDLSSARIEDVLIRIPCCELESWYLGHLDVLEQCFSLNLKQVRNSSKFREPDRLGNAKEELKKLFPAYQEVSHSKEVGLSMCSVKSEENRSESFQAFLSGLNRIINEALA